MSMAAVLRGMSLRNWPRDPKPGINPDMCHFITLIVPPVDLKILNAVLQPYRGDARPIHNPSLAAKLDPGDLQLMTAGHCDCGTVLAKYERSSPEADEARIARLQKRGWSKAKIERSVANRNHARARPRATVDSIAMWSGLIEAVLTELPVKRAGLFLHFYNGNIETEALQPGLRLAPQGAPVAEALNSFNEDEVLIFARPAA